MRKKHLELALYVVIGLELLAMVVLVTWATFVRHKPVSINDETATTSTRPPARMPTLQPVLYAQGLTNPTAIASPDTAGDNRLFVTERRGTIQVITKGKLAAAPVLDITAKVLDDGGEMGLLGIALHPNIKTNSYLYVNYIDRQQNTTIARYKISAQTGVADPASEKVLLQLKQPYSNHNGGVLQFGPDGHLYAGLGDGGSAGDPENRAQNKDTLFGKVLRLDVDHGDPYAIPADNPFKTTSNARPEIWAWGLRNPWRLSFDRKTGDLYIADVGQNKYEEIDFQKAGDKGGENYGWRCYEGTHVFKADGCGDASAYTMPAIEYDHSSSRCSVTGGYVYRGSRYPNLVGKYVYGDYCGGQLYYAAQAGGAWQVTDGASTHFSISTFGQDSDGELYLADMASGTLYHLTDGSK